MLGLKPEDFRVFVFEVVGAVVMAVGLLVIGVAGVPVTGGLVGGTIGAWVMHRRNGRRRQHQGRPPGRS